MAMTPEARVKKAVKDMLKELGIYNFSPNMNGFGRAGVPDIICCARGTFVGIECKAGKNAPTPLQERELDAIEAAGGYTFVVRETNLTDLRILLERLCRK